LYRDADLGRFNVVETSEVSDVTTRHDEQVAKKDVPSVERWNMDQERMPTRMKGTAGNFDIAGDLATH
jgi:hypothetical protein